MLYIEGKELNNKALAVVVLSIFALSMASSAIAPVKAIPQILVRNPLTGNSDFKFSTDTTSVGFKFNATLWVSSWGTPPVFGWQVGLTYNSSVLSVTRAWLAAGDPEYIFHAIAAFGPPPALEPGRVVVGATSLSATATPPPDPAKLGTVEFQIMLAPSAGGTVSSNLVIDNTDTYLLDDGLNEITITKTGGYYEFSAPGAPPPSISISVDKTQVTVGSTVTVSGSIKPVAAGIGVTIFYRQSLLSQSWANLTTVTTDSSGNYLYPWIPMSEGTFELKSGWNAVNSTVVSVTVLTKPLKTFDVNGDGTVDIKDISMVALAFGSYDFPQATEPRWNPAYDFNDDNQINIIDLVSMAKHFGAAV